MRTAGGNGLPHPRQLVASAGAQVGQVIARSLLLLLLYAYLIRVLGAEGFGLWTLLLASVSTLGVAGLGLQGCLVRHVAVARARGRAVELASTTETAVLAVAASSALAVGALVLARHAFLAALLPDHLRSSGYVLLPFIVGSFWMLMVAGVYGGCLDGLELFSLRVRIELGANLVFALLAVPLAFRYGLVGLGWAQVVALALQLVAHAAAVRRRIAGLPLLPHRFSRAVLPGLLRDGLHLQWASAANILLEPLAKILISHFDSVAAVSWFEIANRLAGRIRDVFVAAARVLVPRFAALGELGGHGTSQELGRRAFRLTALLLFPAYGIVCSMTEWFDRIWGGAGDSGLAILFLILVPGWLVNGLSAPAYFENVGSGSLARNTVAHMLQGGVTGLLGAILGLALGSAGVSLGMSLGLAFAGWYLMRSRMTSWAAALQPADRQVIAVSAIAPLVGQCVHIVAIRAGVWLGGMAGSLAAAMVLAKALWDHPLRPRIQALVRGTLSHGLAELRLRPPGGSTL